MANKKVSEMTEIENVESLDNKYVYVVTQSEDGNTYNKMSLRTLQNNISGGIGIPDWTKLYSIRQDATDQTITISKDSYIMGANMPGSPSWVVVTNTSFFGIIIDETTNPIKKLYPLPMSTTGVYVKAGTKLFIPNYTSLGDAKSITVVPLVGT